MEFLVYMLAGAATGLLSGLFGVGGGIIIVSILSFMFTQAHFPETHIMHMALGTSLATIIFTSISSARAHHKNRNVDWRIVRQMAPSVVIGTLSGTLLASQLHSIWLKAIFGIFVMGIAIQLFAKPKASASKGNVTNQDAVASPNHETAQSSTAHSPLPGQGLLLHSVAGLMIGVISSLVGIGGGTITVPYLIHLHTGVRRAIGTSAAIGLPIALAGAVGFIINGLAIQHTADNAFPAWSLGFVYLPAFAGIAVVSVFTAPLGTQLAQRLPTIALKRLLALLLVFVGVKMLWSIT